MVILSEIDEGSSSGHNHNNKRRYDVFLSFRGTDTRNNFTDHLYNTLVNDDISTFLDDEEIETGKALKPELENAIKSARASIVVLSENYATSRWCLDELVLILEQRWVSDQIVIPIFYHVDPTDVRKQLNSFGDAIAEHRRTKMEAEPNAEKRVKWGEKIDQWIKALTEVAGLKGKSVKGRREPDFIEEIVIEIRQRLGVSLSGTLPLLIGRDCEIEEITSWLRDGSSSHTADILTVLGMGGIGKTSLAKYIFHLHSGTFDRSSFINNINSRCTGTFNGLLDVQKQIYDIISKHNKLLVHDPHVYTSKIEKALGRVKVFLVLDDIDTLDQLDALLGNKGFHPGSKILITTRNASLTERCALFKSEVERKHTTLKVEGLYDAAAMKLLRLHAFNCNDTKEGYGEVIKKLMKYCKGHPLAIEVLGKSLYNRDITYWEECVETLKNEPRSDIRTVLQMSFNSLPSSNDKELFKHIACFFVGIDREISEKILKACNINAKSGITNLIERCLLSVDQENRSLMMHQLLEEMGKAIVREESPDEPGKRSRLWCHDESFRVLKRKKGTEKLKGLVFDKRMLEKEKFCDLKTDAFRNMDNLMILHLNYVQLSGSYKNFPKNLRWLRLHGFPEKSIPLDIPMEKLVVLDISYSYIKSFGPCSTSCNPQPLQGGQKVIGSCTKGKRILPSLKILDLSFCEQLHKLCGFYELPTLERLIVRNCIRLVDICESLEECVELVHIDLSYCVKLEKLPTTIHKLKKDCKLLLDGCNTGESILRQLVPSGMRISFPSSLVSLSLADNNLSNESFPVDMSCLSRLKYLCLDKNPIVSMPNCVRSLCSLEELSMSECKTLMSIEHPPCALKRLKVWTPVVSSVKPLLQRILFDPDMSPVSIDLLSNSFRAWSYEIEGMVKIQPLEGVEEKLLSSLGWTKLLDLLDIRQAVTYCDWRGTEQSQIQMYYEFGIFSIIYGGQSGMMMPDWISWSISSQKTPISFTIPSSPNKLLRGLNFCYVLRKSCFPRAITDGLLEMPTIKISNKTKNRTWIYIHCIEVIDVGGEWLTFLSHWMFGMNEMEAGDSIIITLEGEDIYDEDDNGSMQDDDYANEFTKNCGVGFMYQDEKEEDALKYYKSWNHIIGGDLSSFQTTTGEYFLYQREFRRDSNMYPPTYRAKYASLKYKEETVPFRAFSSPKIPPKGAKRQRLSA